MGIWIISHASGHYKILQFIKILYSKIIILKKDQSSPEIEPEATIVCPVVHH